MSPDCRVSSATSNSTLASQIQKPPQLCFISIGVKGMVRGHRSRNTTYKSAGTLTTPRVFWVQPYTLSEEDPTWPWHPTLSSFHSAEFAPRRLSRSASPQACVWGSRTHRRPVGQICAVWLCSRGTLLGERHLLEGGPDNEVKGRRF